MRNIVISIMLGLLVSCSSSLNLQQGIRSFQTQDYRQAFIHLRPAAEKGSPEAQYAVGYMYYYGQGVIENRQKAWYWITKAAQNGNQDAQRAMRILHKNGGNLE
ncbi:MAG: tetratricopeptide repeat protein [Gammaproteobacteria bacterium]